MVFTIVLIGRAAFFIVAAALICGRSLLSERIHDRMPLVDKDDVATSTSTDAVSVPVKVYVEALCIDSKAYMLESVVPAFDKLGRGVMNLEVVAYGNARINDPDDRTMTCQHGAAECDANAYEQCAVDCYPDTQLYLPFIKCLFETLEMHHQDTPNDEIKFRECTFIANLSWEAIRDCRQDDDRVWKLQMMNANKTPAHKYVPWVVVDGLHIDEEQQDLLQVVCDAYQQAGGQNASCAMIE